MTTSDADMDDFLNSILDEQPEVNQDGAKEPAPTLNKVSISEQEVGVPPPSKREDIEIVEHDHRDQFTLFVDDKGESSEPNLSDDALSKSVSVITTNGHDRHRPIPDPQPYDPLRENVEYTRSLLSDEERKSLDASIRKDGFMTVESVRELVRQNTAKESMDARGELYAIDPELMILLDSRTNYKIYIAGDNVYTREELCAHYPFVQFGVAPESIFVQQEIGIFPAKKFALAESQFEYVARDVGDETIDFVMIEDMVGKAAKGTKYKAKRAPVRIVKTKVFLGKERWDSFSLLHRLAIGIKCIATAQLEGPSGDRNPLLMLLQAGTDVPLLMDSDTAEREKKRREEIEKELEQARLEERRRHEAEMRAREEKLAQMEKKIQTDIARIETMFTTVAQIKKERKKAQVETKTPVPPPSGLKILTESTPGKAVQTSAVPAKPVQTSAVPAKPVQTPAVPAKPVQTPAVPAKPVQTPAVPAKPVQTPAVPAKAAQTATTPGKAAQTPAVPAKPVQTPAVPAKAAQTATTPGKAAQTPAVPAKPVQTPAVPAKAAQTATTPGKAAQTPAVPAKPVQTPAVPAKAAQTATTPAKEAQTPAVPAKPVQTPAVPAKPVQTPAVPAKAAQTAVVPAKAVQTPAVPAKAAQTPAVPAKAAQTSAAPAKPAQTSAVPAKATLLPAVALGPATQMPAHVKAMTGSQNRPRTQIIEARPGTEPNQRNPQKSIPQPTRTIDSSERHLIDMSKLLGSSLTDPYQSLIGHINPPAPVPDDEDSVALD